MERIKKNFDFGCMRLPMKGGEVDIPQTKQMVDAFLFATMSSGKFKKQKRPIHIKQIDLKQGW